MHHRAFCHINDKVKHHATSCASQIISSLYWHYAYNMIHYATFWASQSILSNIWHNAYNTLDLTTSFASQSILSHKWQSETSCYIHRASYHFIHTMPTTWYIMQHFMHSRVFFQIFDTTSCASQGTQPFPEIKKSTNLTHELIWYC